MRRTHWPHPPDCVGAKLSGNGNGHSSAFSSSFKQVTLLHVYGAYVVLAGGFAAAVAVFALEKAFWMAREARSVVQREQDTQLSDISE